MAEVQVITDSLFGAFEFRVHVHIPVGNGHLAKLAAAAAHPEAIVATAAGPVAAKQSASLSQSCHQTLLPQAATRCCRRIPVQHTKHAHKNGDSCREAATQSHCALAGILLPM